MNIRRVGQRFITPLAVWFLAGCAAAAVGASAAGAGIYLTSRGAEAVVEGSIEDVAAATQIAFNRLSIESSGRKEETSGDVDELEIYGRLGEDEVTVDVEQRAEGVADVEVRVQKSAVTWDKDMASEILEEIKQLVEGDDAT